MKDTETKYIVIGYSYDEPYENSYTTFHSHKAIAITKSGTRIKGFIWKEEVDVYTDSKGNTYDGDSYTLFNSYSAAKKVAEKEEVYETWY